MSKEKILAIIDTEFLLGYESCYDIHDDSYTGQKFLIYSFDKKME